MKDLEKKTHSSSPLYFISGSIFIITLLFGVNQIFAIFYPSETLNPNCVPGANGCTVAVEPVLFTTTLIDDTDSIYSILPTDQIIYADSTNGDVEIALPDITNFSSTGKRTIIITKTIADNVVYIYADINDDQINDNRTAIQLNQDHQTVKLESVSDTQWIADFNYEANPVSPLSVRVATTVELTATYDNGTAGVGATLTGAGAIGVIDTVTLALNDRLLVKEQTTNPEENGVYEVTVLNPFELTRTTDADEDTELDHQIIIPSAGSKVNRVKKYTQQTALPNIGTDSIIYTETGATVTQSASGTQLSGQIAFWTNTARELSKGAARLFWNNNANMLGIGFTNPALIAATLNVRGSNDGSDILIVEKHGNPVALTDGGRIVLGSGDGGDGDALTIGGDGGAISMTAGDGGIGNGAGGGNASRITVSGGNGGDDTADVGGNGSGLLIQGGHGGEGLNFANDGHAGNIRIYAGDPNTDGAGRPDLTTQGGGPNSGNVYINPYRYTDPDTLVVTPFARDKNVAIGVDANPVAKLDILENKEIDDIFVPENDSVATRIQNDATYTDPRTLGTRNRTNLEITSDVPATDFLNNYGIMVEEPTGATNNYSLYLKGNTQTRVIDSDTGAYLSNGGVWTDVSSKSKKENYESLDKNNILEKIINIPIEKWNYIVDSKKGIKHIGPYAEDFYAIFGIGDGDKNIAALDTAGVALAGVQALNEKVDAMGVELYIENEGPRDIAEKIANVLQEIGVTIIDGVINVKALVANVVSAKKVVTNNFEMVDKADGKTYCVSLNNGNFDKIEGSCK